MKKLNTNEIISKNRRKYYLKIHLVLVTKYRKSILINEFNVFIKESIKLISLKYSFKIDLINSDKNHIHILISFTPNLTVSSIVRVIKQESTVISWKHYNSYLSNYYFKEKTLWSDGYFVSSVGYIDENTIKNYIKLIHLLIVLFLLLLYCLVCCQYHIYDKNTYLVHLRTFSNANHTFYMLWFYQLFLLKVV